MRGSAGRRAILLRHMLASLTEAANGLAHVHGERGDGFQPLDGGFEKRSTVPAADLALRPPAFGLCVTEQSLRLRSDSKFASADRKHSGSSPLLVSGIDALP